VDVDARIEGLQAEVGRLQGRVDQLEAAMGMTLAAPLEWRLTPAEQRVFGVLMARELATKDAVMAGVYRDAGRDEPEIKIVDVFVCKIRAKLKRFEIPIETVWGQGYRLPAEAKARVRERLALEAA
jgi:two-component system cell cycle response regulator CtrA